MDRTKRTEQDQKQVSRSTSRTEKHELRRRYRKLTKLKRVQSCGRPGLRSDGSVVARVTEGVKDAPYGRLAGFGGLFSCGNPWACVTCAERISAVRAGDLAAVLTHYIAGGGWAVLISMTMRHHLAHSLEQQLDALSYGWSKATSGQAWHEGKPESYAGWCKVTEITDGPNGWHAHVHAVIVFESRPADWVVDALADGMFDRWSRAVQRKGMLAPLRDSGGLDVRHLDGDLERTPEEMSAVWAAYLAKGLAGEATLTGGKEARGQNRSIRELMRDAMLPQRWEDPATGEVAETVDLRARDRLAEYEAATHGRRVMTWSRAPFDLRKAAGLAEERKDEAIVEEDELQGEDVAVITAEGWRVLERMRGQAELLDVLEREGADAGRRWLQGHDVEFFRPTGLTDQRRRGSPPGSEV